jgi:hypothetical protein
MYSVLNVSQMRPYNFYILWSYRGFPAHVTPTPANCQSALYSLLHILIEITRPSFVPGGWSWD